MILFLWKLLNQKLVKALSQIKHGDKIQVQWDQMAGEIGYVKVIANDPEAGKVLISIVWLNYKEANKPERQSVIFDYWGKELKNFLLLNQPVVMSFTVIPTALFTEQDLNDRLNEALESENYELAKELQDKIKKLKL